MTLSCPLCDQTLEMSELEKVPETVAGRRCPRCRNILRYYQPYRALRVTISALMSAALVWVANVRSLPIFLLSTFVVWVPLSLIFNSYLIRVIPFTLVPWKPRSHVRAPVEIVNDRNATIQLFKKK